MENMFEYILGAVIGGIVTSIFSCLIGVFNTWSIIFVALLVIGAILLAIFLFNNSEKLDKNKKILIIGSIGVLLVVAVGTGYLLNSDDSADILYDETSNTTNVNTTSNDSVDSNDISASADYKIVINYDGPYTAGYGTEFDNYDFTSEGHTEFDVGNTSFINVGAKKSDGSSGKLTISIMNGDKVVEEKSTTAPHGEIKVHFSG